MNPTQLEQVISARSYEIWEREGREPGHDAEYWERAKKEIDQEMRAALEGERTDIVLPRLTVSQRPLRRDAHPSF